MEKNEKKKFRSHKKCSVCGKRACSEDGKKLFMARFPLHPNRCKQWIKATGNEELIYIPVEKLHSMKYICGLHFGDKQFNKKRKRLKRFAVPTKNLNSKILPEALFREFPYHVFQKLAVHEDHSYSCIIQNSQTENLRVDHDYTGTTFQDITHEDGILIVPDPLTSADPLQDVNNVVNTPGPSTYDDEPANTFESEKETLVSSDPKDTLTIKKLLKRINGYKKKIKQLKKQDLFSKIKSERLKSFIRTYVRNEGKKPHGKRYTNLEKSSALAIYKKSPQEYKNMQQITDLPSIRTLNTFMQQKPAELEANDILSGDNLHDLFLHRLMVQEHLEAAEKSGPEESPLI